MRRRHGCPDARPCGPPGDGSSRKTRAWRCGRGRRLTMMLVWLRRWVRHRSRLTVRHSQACHLPPTSPGAGWSMPRGAGGGQAACRNRQVGSTPTRARASSSLSPATTYSSTSALSKTAAGWKQARPWSSTSLRAARAPRPPTCARSSPNSHPPALGLPGVGGAAACRPQHQRLLHGGRSGPTHRRLRSSARQQADELVGRLPVQTSTPAAPENSSSRRRGWGSDTLFDAYRRPVPPG